MTAKKLEPTAPIDLSPETLAGLVAIWQQRLRLQDWDLDVNYVRGYDMSDRLSYGEIDVFQEKKFAKIDLLTAGDAFPGGYHGYDLERTLVHELLHIHLAPLRDDSKMVFEEQAIHAISVALVDAYRK